MKHFIKFILQSILGYERYLYLFARFKIKLLFLDKKENDFLKFVSLLPSEGDVMDIGANIGVMTYFLSKKIKNGNIYSFEPIPSNIEIINRILKKYKLRNVMIFPYALGNENCKVKMLQPINRSVRMHGLSYVKDNNKKETDIGIEYYVPCRILDYIDEFNSPQFNLKAIKIDVENYEFNVLLGSVNLISRFKPLIYTELWENENRVKSIELLTSIGYKTFVNIKNELVPFQPNIHFTQNFFFLPHGFRDY